MSCSIFLLLPSPASSSPCCGLSFFLSSIELLEAMATLVPEENMVSLVSRTGRHMQRYSKGRRQVVGCIPYRYRTTVSAFGDEEEIEVLVISSQKGKGLLFPMLQHTNLLGAGSAGRSLIHSRTRITFSLLLQSNCVIQNMGIVLEEAVTEFKALMDEVEEPLKKTFQLVDCLNWRVQNQIDNMLAVAELG